VAVPCWRQKADFVLSSDITCSLNGQIGFITFNRPQVHNAISLEMWAAIPGVMDKLLESGARVIVFLGEGDSFASGADLDELKAIDGEDSARRIWHQILNCFEHIWSFRIPTIAMIHGSCIGGGCLLATACDFRIASKHSFFAVPVSRLGLMLDDRTIGRLVAAGGVPFAKELLLASMSMNAERAYSLGYLNQLVEVGQLNDAVGAFAEQISRNVGSAVEASKRSINIAAGLPERTSQITDEQIVASYLSEEFRKRVGG